MALPFFMLLFSNLLSSFISPSFIFFICFRCYFGLTLVSFGSHSIRLFINSFIHSFISVLYSILFFLILHFLFFVVWNVFLFSCFSASTCLSVVYLQVVPVYPARPKYSSSGLPPSRLVVSRVFPPLPPFTEHQHKYLLFGSSAWSVLPSASHTAGRRSK